MVARLDESDIVPTKGFYEVAVMLSKDKHTVSLEQLLKVPPVVLGSYIYKYPPIGRPLQPQEVEAVYPNGEFIAQSIHRRLVQRRPIADYERPQLGFETYLELETECPGSSRGLIVAREHGISRSQGAFGNCQGIIRACS